MLPAYGISHRFLFAQGLRNDDVIICKFFEQLKVHDE